MAMLRRRDGDGRSRLRLHDGMARSACNTGCVGDQSLQQSTFVGISQRDSPEELGGVSLSWYRRVLMSGVGG
ncbi:MAG: hypothetical protein U1E83_01970 [Methylotetracoccus sp.]